MLTWPMLIYLNGYHHRGIDSDYGTVFGGKEGPSADYSAPERTLSIHGLAKRTEPAEQLERNSVEKADTEQLTRGWGSLKRN